MKLPSVDESKGKGKRQVGAAKIAWGKWPEDRLPVLKRNMILSTVMVLALCGPAQAAKSNPSDPGSATDNAQVDADNTGRNVRDRGGDSLTPMDQSADTQDVQITRNIRQAIVADDSLGVTAHNIKAITIKGRVTLRGPVETTTERTCIVNVAEPIAGADNVTDELEVAVR